MAEVCENCGATIGKLETAHLYNEKVVCATCADKLHAAEKPTPVPVVPIPKQPVPVAIRSGSGVPCQICQAGQLMPRKKYRLSGPAVVIGYILLIPSVMGIAICVLMLLLSIAAPVAGNEGRKALTTAQLKQAHVPPEIIEATIAGSITNEQINALPPEQAKAVHDAKKDMVENMVAGGILAVFMGGGSICLGVSLFVSGLLGWLLVMKKKVLQCTTCGAVIAAS